MIESIQNTIKTFLERFEMTSPKVDTDTAATILASEIFVNHILEEETEPVVVKRRGRRPKSEEVMLHS